MLQSCAVSGINNYFATAGSFELKLLLASRMNYGKQELIKKEKETAKLRDLYSPLILSER